MPKRSSTRKSSLDLARSSPRTARQRWVGLGIALLIVAGALTIARPFSSETSDEFGPAEQVQPVSAVAAELPTGPQTGNLAPNFHLQTLEGDTVRLSDLRGQPVFLNFWATWCFACITEMPAMQQLADRYEGELVVIGVNVDQSREVAAAFALQEEIRYQLLLDPGASVTEAYRVRSMPTSMFIDRDGVIHSIRFGELSSSEMEEHAAPLLTS
ncbi:MAG: redoxin domain-containing protein [Thermomicrobiales bacterium]